MEHYTDLPSPQIVYRTGASGPTAVIAGTNLRVQTFVIAVTTWGMTPAEAAEDYGLPLAHVLAALQFYAEHRAEIDEQIAAEDALEAAFESAAMRQGSENERDRTG